MENEQINSLKNALFILRKSLDDNLALYAKTKSKMQDLPTLSASCDAR